MALIDIILPTYNNGKWLLEAVDSILKQSFNDFNLIIIDDGSTDQSTSYLPFDNRIKLFKKKHQGLVPALNFGISKSKAKWIARADGDDLLHIDRLKLQIEYAIANKLDWVSCKVKAFDYPIDKIGYPEYIKWHNSLLTHDQIIKSRFIECPVIHPTWLLKRTLYIKNNHYESGSFPEDFDFFLKASKNIKIGKVPKTLLYWRDWPDRVSRSSPNFKPKNFLKLKIKYFSTNKNRPIIILGTGNCGKTIAKELIKRKYSIKYFVDIDPKKINTIINYIPVKSIEYFQENLKNIDTKCKPYALNSIMTRGSRKTVSKLLNGLKLEEEQDYMHFQ